MYRGIHQIITPHTNILKDMKNKTDQADSSLSETMAARIEIKELGDPAHQKKITDAVQALDGVIETKIAKGALHVSYRSVDNDRKENRARYPLHGHHHQSCGHRYGRGASRIADITGSRTPSGDAEQRINQASGLKEYCPLDL